MLPNSCLVVVKKQNITKFSSSNFDVKEINHRKENKNQQKFWKVALETRTKLVSKNQSWLDTHIIVQMRHPYIRANSLLLSVSVRYTSSIKAKLNSYSRTIKNDQTSPQNLFVYLKRTDVYMLLDIPSQIFIDSTVCWSKAKKKSDIINV